MDQHSKITIANIQVADARTLDRIDRVSDDIFQLAINSRKAGQPSLSLESELPALLAASTARRRVLRKEES